MLWIEQETSGAEVIKIINYLYTMQRNNKRNLWASRIDRSCEVRVDVCYMRLLRDVFATLWFPYLTRQEQFLWILYIVFYCLMLYFNLKLLSR